MQNMSPEGGNTKANAINIMTLLLLLGSMFFCLLGVLAASFPMNDIKVEFMDTSMLTPQMSVFVGFILLIPSIVMAFASIGIWFTFGFKPARRSTIECEAALERLREITLQTYLDQISDLILEQGLRHSDQDTIQAKVAAKARRLTLMTLQELDGRRKRKVLRFLYESHLITGESIIDLKGADLSGSELQELNLSGVHLIGADLRGANLSKSNLSAARITSTQLATVKSLEGAILPDGLL